VLDGRWVTEVRALTQAKGRLHIDMTRSYSVIPHRSCFYKTAFPRVCLLHLNHSTVTWVLERTAATVSARQWLNTGPRPMSLTHCSLSLSVLPILYNQQVRWQQSRIVHQVALHKILEMSQGNHLSPHHKLQTTDVPIKERDIFKTSRKVHYAERLASTETRVDHQASIRCIHCRLAHHKSVSSRCRNLQGTICENSPAPFSGPNAGGCHCLIPCKHDLHRSFATILTSQLAHNLMGPTAQKPRSRSHEWQ